MKKGNFRLILRSLVSNNACIDGGRNKKWYFAVPMFIISVIVSLVPSFVKTLKTNGDDMFDAASYGADIATVRFLETVKADTNKTLIVRANGEEDNYLEVVGWNEGEYIDHKHTTAEGEKLDFRFAYTPEINEDKVNEISGDKTYSVVVFSKTELYISIVNQNTTNVISQVYCRKAFKHVDAGFDFDTLLSEKTPETKEYIEETWGNMLAFIKDAYTSNKLKSLWQNCVLLGSINIVVTALMGFMIWILCRGKNNPYRIFKFWECQKTAYWATMTPALLTCGLGFLFTNFANVLFPMCVGIRVMWLSMKSLRPDGTGYAAN